MEQDLSWSIAQTGLPLITIELTTDDGKKGNLCLDPICGNNFSTGGKRILWSVLSHRGIQGYEAYRE